MGISTSLASRARDGSSPFGGHRQHRDLDEDNDSTFSASGSSDVILSSTVSPQPWTVIRSETLATWKYAAVLWGFDPRIDYTSNVKARLQPWCTGGRHLIVRHEPPTRLLLQRPHCVLTIVEGCFRQDTFVRLPSSYATRLHIEPDPAGHYLKSAQVPACSFGQHYTDNDNLSLFLHFKCNSFCCVTLCQCGIGYGPLSVCLSVCLCHRPVFYQNCLTCYYATNAAV